MHTGTLRNLFYVAAIAAALTLTVGLGTATWLGYRWFTESRMPSVDRDGDVRARVISATLYGRNDLRVARLSGRIQGVGQASRLWGFLNSSQVVIAPYHVDYFVPLGKIKASNITVSENGQKFVITLPDIYTDQPNIDLARTTLDRVRGVFVTRSASAEMVRRVSASAQQAASEKAQSPEYREKTRAYARDAVKRFFEGALRAARVDAELIVRFGDENNEQMERSRSLEDVYANRF